VVVGAAAQEEDPAGTLAPAEPVNLEEKVIAITAFMFSRKRESVYCPFFETGHLSCKIESTHSSLLF
jgi:Fe-S-cluster containining protein